MQTREALVRVARECAQDLADDGVVYAEVRFAPELHLEGGLSLPRSSRRCRRATGRAATAARSGS
jgi:adenosine deaminase